MPPESSQLLVNMYSGCIGAAILCLSCSLWLSFILIRRLNLYTAGIMHAMIDMERVKVSIVPGPIAQPCVRRTVRLELTLCHAFWPPVNTNCCSASGRLSTSSILLQPAKSSRHGCRSTAFGFERPHSSRYRLVLSFCLRRVELWSKDASTTVLKRGRWLRPLFFGPLRRQPYYSS